MIRRYEDDDRETLRRKLRTARKTITLALFFYAVYVGAQALFTVTRLETFETDLRTLAVELNTVGRTAYKHDFAEAARRTGVKLAPGDVTVDIEGEEYRIAAWYNWEVDLVFRTMSGRVLSTHKTRRWPNGAW